MQPELATVAKSVQKLLEGRNEDSIAIGDFSGPAQIDSNFGPGIQQGLAAELTALKVRIDRKAKYSAKGEYLTVADKNVKDLISVRLIVRVFDQFATELVALPIDLKGTNDLGKILAPTVSLPPKGDRRERNETIQKSLDKPKVHIDGSKVSTKQDSPFAVEVVVKGEGRKAKVEEAQAFVEIQREEIYEVVLHNKSHLEAAITPNIDGLDVFTFSELRNEKTGHPKYSHFVIPANGSTVIKGWHKNNKEALSFLVTEYGKGAASEAKVARGKIGVLTVTFAFAWSGKEPPDEEKGARDGGNETGFGPPQKVNLNEVHRQIGVVRDIVSIRYTR